MHYRAIDIEDQWNISPGDDIWRGAAGDIDFDYYLAKGRRERARAAAGLIDRIGRQIRRLFG